MHTQERYTPKLYGRTKGEETKNVASAVILSTCTAGRVKKRDESDWENNEMNKPQLSNVLVVGGNDGDDAAAAVA